MLETIALIALLSPLIGGAIAGFACRRLTRQQAQEITIAGMGLSVLACLLLLINLSADQSFEYSLYQWADLGWIEFEVGFLLDRLSVLMALVVSVVSLLVHIYTIGYMYDEPDWSHNRFFCYISLFTFFMLSLVLSNNFLQLFFGWEGVGLMSYLLIGFWFKRPMAIQANLKAFLINRVGDFGFLLAIALIAWACTSLNYGEIFAASETLSHRPPLTVAGIEITFVTAVCLLLFVGAMGKSAQIPLHAWLPDSMEGPTPISALIHAATMVTAGIYMVARMSPLFELSEVALNTVLVVGVLTAFTMGLVGLVQNDIKRVIAYSTLSQLGYMTAALGLSAYHLAFFHLVTHAFFKALLFLAAGSVIVALHHQQDMRKMGGLRKSMPITYITCLIGTLALIGMPGFSGFYSKDLIIEFAHRSVDGWLTNASYLLLLSGVFVTALYSFRLLFMVFHGASRFKPSGPEQPRESPPTITAPLIVLAVPSLLLGMLSVDWFLTNPDLSNALYISAANQVDVSALDGMTLLQHSLLSPVLWLTLAGVLVAWLLYGRPVDRGPLVKSLSLPITVLEKKYGFDYFYVTLVPRWSLAFARGCWHYCDQKIIDQWVVLAWAKLVGRCSKIVCRLQSGYLYDYILMFVMTLVALWFAGLSSFF